MAIEPDRILRTQADHVRVDEARIGKESAYVRPCLPKFVAQRSRKFGDAGLGDRIARAATRAAASHIDFITPRSRRSISGRSLE